MTQPHLTADVSSLASKITAPRPYTSPSAPNSIDDVQAIASWQSLFRERRAWALRLVDDGNRMTRDIHDRYDEIDVMVKCIDAAMANLEMSVKQIEPKYTELKKWVTPALTEHDHLVSGWQKHLDLAKRTPTSSRMVVFMTKHEVEKARPTLEDLVEPDTVKKAGKLAPTAKRRFSDKAAELEKANKQMHKALEGIVGKFNGLMARSFLGRSEDAPQLLEDIEAVVKQIDVDYRTTLSHGSSPREVAQASKTASNHTERLVPSLKKRMKEMDDMVRYATNARNDVAAESIEFMQIITDVTSLHSDVKAQINILNQSEDDMTTFDYLRLIHQLPYMYASFLVEAIRRKEWADKIKTDSSTLANEMALFQDEESKRRRKWHKMVGSTYGPSLDTNVVGLEVNLLGDDTPWPLVEKAELDQFIQTLRNEDADQTVLDDVVALAEELNNPTKQQSKRLKAFKNGSIHEAALGRSGLMIRGDDELLRSLQDDKGKLETRLKTAESRVRRLEDLLHRQSQASRPTTLFQPSTPQARDRTDSTSSNRSNRLGDRRRSSDGADPLLRRIAQLEGELAEEKRRAVQASKDLASQEAQLEEKRTQVEETNSTKKDLLENMEALKREFDTERKSLEDEVKTLKARLEDTEDEIDHFGASRENEKANYDERVHVLETEIDRLQKTKQDGLLRAEGQVEYLTNETRIQRERLDELEGELEVSRQENRTSSKKQESAEEAANTAMDTLKILHHSLQPNSATPDAVQQLADVLPSLLTDLLENLRTAEGSVSLARAELDQARTVTDELRSERNLYQQRLDEEARSASQLEDAVSEQKAKVVALDREVREGREQLHLLRAQLSDGETGSEIIQGKLEETEKKASNLSEQLASKQSQIGSLEGQVATSNDKLNSALARLSEANERYDSRDDRTRNLTQKLYAQNDRLCRLLERIGYSVARESGNMTISKVPRSERTSQNPNDSSDPGTSLRRSGTLNNGSLHDSADLDLLYWTKADDGPTEQDKFDRFMKTLGHFDTDLFSETIYRRLKDTEHKARKWQRDCRAYRERAHAMQKDAQDKIAFRHFKEGDLALFLPTRNQQAGAWAAFNVGFPHYFLREQDAHRLRNREWLVARITRIQEKVVDLSKSLQTSNESDSLNTEENDNPFQLSDGLRWYLIDAQEDKPGAPSTPGMGKSTVAANTVEATASIHAHGSGSKGKNRDSVASIEGINKTLSKSLDSRRSSTGSKKALPFAGAVGGSLLKGNPLASETTSLRAIAPETPVATSPVQGGLTSPQRTETARVSGGSSTQNETLGQGESKSSEVHSVDTLFGP